MSDSVENRLPLLVQSLRYIQNANQVLAESLEYFSENPAATEARQMDRLSGVAFLMELMSQQVDLAQKTLKEEIASR